MGTTSKYLIPYPEGTDAPDGATQMRNLATKVDQVLDTTFSDNTDLTAGYYTKAQVDDKKAILKAISGTIADGTPGAITATVSNIPGSSVTFTARTGYTYLVGLTGGLSQTTGNSGASAFMVRESATIMGPYVSMPLNAGAEFYTAGIKPITFGAGAHTLWISAQTGTGCTAQFRSPASVPALLYVLEYPT